ncbi:MAG: DNA polymerase III subunit gamma/tau [Alphaproteobacteria bacterium]|jgi:DNA polymerase III subunit gamma/tau|nr:DNA polymerase III subunit gamma/tau [Alphaproteobacteria bacterium]
MADAEQPVDAQPYRVLARKYRPQTFDDLIGQEAMVRTLTNAFERDRIAQAYLLSGVRGIGKTTTARIIARALNCEGPDGDGGPTIQPCGVCRQCRDIIEDRHVDVVEMDAASNNSVDNIREITEASRYRPASARYKVYILDEAHMLSNAAFNALLKTLEEPPPHLKFIFATTESRKLPVTVLSRCQRFDLRRVPPDRLAAHFGSIAEKEGARVEEEALAMIARAADGSVRDGLSLLDQGIALAEADGLVTADQVRGMLGLSDRLAAYDLFEAAMGGDAKAALDQFSEMLAIGADPAAALQDLMEAAYWTTRLGVDPAGADFAASSAAERERAAGLAKRLNLPALSRAWQLLSKGHAETLSAPNPRLSAEMTLIRLAYAANMPTPDDLIRRIDNEAQRNSASGGSAPQAAPAAPAPNATATRSTAAADASGPVAVEAAQSVDIGGGQAARAMASADPAPVVEAARPEAEATPAPVLEPTQEPAPEPPKGAESPGAFPDFESLLAHLSQVGAARGLSLIRRLRLVEYAAGRIVYEDQADLPENYARRLREELGKATDRVWSVESSTEAGQPSQVDAEASADAMLRAHPLVIAALATFPGAQLTVGRPQLEAPEPEPLSNADMPNPPISADGEIGYDNPDVVYDDDINFGDWELDD